MMSAIAFIAKRIEFLSVEIDSELGREKLAGVSALIT